MAPAREPEATGRQWTPWTLREETDHQNLARYVNADIAELTRLRLFVENPFYQRENDSAALLGRLYEALRAKKIAYEHEPWNAEGEQVIRDAGTVDSSFGTCLDLSLLFAAMCKQAGLRPYIAVLRRGSHADHALVLVDTAAAVNRSGTPPPVTLAEGPHPRHVYRRLPFAPKLGPTGLAVDVTAGCRGENDEEGHDFATACADGARTLLHADYRDCVLIDVVALHADGFPPYEPLPPGKRPVITRRLPMRPSFIPYESRSKLLDDLTGATGTIVLYGDQGTGKSMLALDIAAKAQFGCGWFLDANDSSVLATSLGDHEMAESGIGLEYANRASRTEYARLGLARLRQARGSWVTVLDNVDVPPEDLKGYPEPSADKGQLLLITTTHPKWARPRTGVRVFTLPPLESEEVTRELGADAPTGALAGLPLLTNASARFRQETGHDWWTGRVVPAVTAPAHFWHAVRATLGADEGEGAAEDGAEGGAEGEAGGRAQAGPNGNAGEGNAGEGNTREGTDTAALALAASMAWIPPAGLDLATVCDIVVSVAAATHGPGTTAGAVRHAAQRLYRLGLVDLRAGRITMHRLFRHTIRQDMTRRDGPGTSDMVGALVEHLFAAIDSVGRQILLDAGRPAPASSDHAPYGLVISSDDVDEMRKVLVAHTDPRGLHALAGLVERQNEALATSLYAAAEDLIGPWREREVRTLPAGTRLVIVNGLRGKARMLFRDPSSTPEQLEEAVSWMLECRPLCADLPADPGMRNAFLLTASRAEAMYGLLLRKRASREETPAADRLRIYREAERILLESAAQRVALAGDTDSPDVDRSRFNLAGLAIDLAKCDQEHRRAGHLDRAWELYTSVLQMRERRYRTRYLEEVVTCVNGQALVHYYRALVLPGSVQQKAERLRRAAEFAHQATMLRQHVEGTVDGPNTAKSVAITAKIALARMDLRAMTTQRDKDRSDPVTSGYVRERGAWYFLSTSAPPSHRKDSAMRLTFPAVSLAAAGDDLLPAIEDWITSEAMRALVTAFDGDEKDLLGTAGDLQTRVQRLYAFSDRWDNRTQGQERNQSTELPMTAVQRDTVLAATTALGLHDCPSPRHEDYDHVLLLGGLVRACFNRPAFAAQLLDGGAVRTGSVAALGGHRPFSSSKDPDDDEFVLAGRIGHPELVEEYQALDLGTRTAFGLGEPTHVEGARYDDIGGTWGVRHYARPSGTAVRVAAAPSSEPDKRRAHTGDTYAFFAEHMEQLRPGARLLLVTTPIYAPSQHFTALHRLALPYQVHVETVGGDPDDVGEALRQPFTPTRYLAEVRGAVRALTGLVAAATEARGGQ
ncbi:AAA family ATPase [Streptomyces sp. NPDC047028]|uniref:AAA family ATPase n=1 Tax=Streptomyces sp. NPDC047028 TaxID=3155793 RepID=UPI00340CF107